MFDEVLLRKASMVPDRSKRVFFTAVISRMLATHVVCGVASEAGCIFSEGAWSDDRPFTSPSV
jgi:hypothetical protein